MSDVNVYTCPNCNGVLHYDARQQCLKCDNCGSTFTTEEIDEAYRRQDASSADELDSTVMPEAFSEEEAKHLRAYDCPACGAQLIMDETTGATACPYCGNNAIIPSTFRSVYRPEYVIPFKMEKQEAIDKLQEFLKKMPYLPDAFTAENHIEEIKGVYVPFWLYDAKTTGHIRAHCTRTRTHTEGDYRVTTTDHFLVTRDGKMSFENVPVDASSHMPDDLMDSIEPYNFSEMVPFELGYLPGYMADRYDVESEDDEDRVDRRIKNTTKRELSSTINGYTGVMVENEDVRVKRGAVHYALLPVWLLSTNCNGKNYLFAMNGQTGKMIGDTVPRDKGKMIKNFLTIAIIGLILVTAFFLLCWYYPELEALL